MNYAKIRYNDIANGEGVRTSLFVSGCNFHCPGCFNPEVQAFDYGQEFAGDPAIELLESLNNDIVSGLSILGGDPLCQDADGLITLKVMCKIAHMRKKTVWLWSGYTWEQIFTEEDSENYDPLAPLRRELIRNTDVFVDGLFDEKLADRMLVWRGSANQRVIDVQKSLRQGKAVLYGNG